MLENISHVWYHHQLHINFWDNNLVIVQQLIFENMPPRDEPRVSKKGGGHTAQNAEGEHACSKTYGEFTGHISPGSTLL